MKAKVISALLVLMVSACATQTYQPQPIAPQAVAQVFAERTAKNVGLDDVAEWDLAVLTQAAVMLHSDMQIARAKLASAQAASISAGQRPNPSVSVGGEHHSIASSVSPWTLSLGLGLPIEMNGKREARMEQAAALTEVAKLGIAQTAWEVRNRLRSRLLDVYEINRNLQLQAQEQGQRAAVVAMLEKRFAAGLASSVELADARVLLRRAEVAQQGWRGRLGEAYAALAAAIGLPESALDQSKLVFKSFAQNAAVLQTQEVQRAALLNRLDIRQGLASYDAAEAKLKLEIAKQVPDISLGPSYGWDQGDQRWGLSVSTVLALLNKNEGAIGEARAQREMEAKKFEALQAAVIGQQQQALAKYRAALGDVEQSQKLLAAQNLRIEKAQRQFDAGQIDRLELTLTRLEVLAVEATLANAQIKAQQALGLLEDAVQQPLDGSAPLPHVLKLEGIHE